MRKKKLLKQGINKGTALKELEDMLNKADSAWPDKRKANDIVRKARRIAMKLKVHLPPNLKRRFCKHCYSYWKHGENVRVRTREKMLVFYCLECKKYSRFGLCERLSK